MFARAIPRPPPICVCVWVRARACRSPALALSPRVSAMPRSPRPALQRPPHAHAPLSLALPPGPRIATALPGVTHGWMDRHHQASSTPRAPVPANAPPIVWLDQLLPPFLHLPACSRMRLPPKWAVRWVSLHACAHLLCYIVQEAKLTSSCCNLACCFARTASSFLPAPNTTINH